MEFNELRWFLDFCLNNHLCKSDTKICTIDNPGFFIKINLENTQISEKTPQEILIDRSEHDWVHCFIRDNQFECFCGPINLTESLEILYESVYNARVMKENTIPKNNSSFDWLSRWYSRQCNGDWEHGNSIEINFPRASTCHFTVDIKDTEFENQKFDYFTKIISEVNWLECFIQDGKFNGICYPLNLPEVLSIFQKWIGEFEKDSNIFFSSSKLFKKRKIPKDITNIPTKLAVISDIIKSKEILNIIHFPDHLHFVFEDCVSLDAYTKTIFPEEISGIKHAKVIGTMIKYPTFNIQLEGSQFISIDIESTFEGGELSLEFRVPQKYKNENVDWSSLKASYGSWVLFI